ncbi:MAG: PD-(D/E)XK nuclease family protein [Acidobacteriota bacterium]|nr:PD-(D/E)XK nuclease family protein [Acidobacteriota bacterium]
MLAQNKNLSEEARRLRAIFDAASEWLLSGETDFALHSDEIEIAAQNERLILSCLTTEGWKTRRVEHWENKNGKIIFSLAGKFNSEKTKFTFTPRVSAAELSEEVRAARTARAREIAEIARKMFSPQAKIEYARLTARSRRRRTGSFARILLVNPKGKTIAVCSTVLEKTNIEKLLAHSILWLSKLEERRKIAELWLLCEETAAEDLNKLCGLLRGGWRKKMKIFYRISQSEISSENPQTQNEREILRAIEPLSLADLWREKPKKLKRPAHRDLSETAQRIIELAPEAIDAVRSRAGETLRFYGLPFLRIRKILEAETAWFGIEGKRKRILDDASLPDFEKLLEDLLEQRRADVRYRKNFLHSAAPESWLEAILRRDVSRLDPNLRLSPLHAQFRLSNRKGALDLLALRTDGRLVVIELKTAPDREMIFQAVNYWRQIELQRRSGNLQKIGLFDDLKISDAPALVYLVAPLMSFHPEFEILANAISSEIEIWRFDLNEDWRNGIRVAQRKRVLDIK